MNETFDGGPSEPRFSRRHLVVFFAVVGLVGLPLTIAARSPLLLDDITALRMGQMALAGCYDLWDLPWVQPPLVPLIAGALHQALLACGLSEAHAVVGTVFLGRAGLAFSPLVAWLLLRTTLPPGASRWLLAASFAMSPLFLLLSARFVVHGAIVVPTAAAIAGLSAAGSQRPWPVCLAALGALGIGMTSYAGWPLLFGFGLATLWVAREASRGPQGRKAWLIPVVVLGPVALFILSWLPALQPLLEDGALSGALTPMPCLSSRSARCTARTRSVFWFTREGTCAVAGRRSRLQRR